MPQPKLHASHAHRQAAYHRRREEAQLKQLEEKGLLQLPAVSSIPGTARWRQAIKHVAHLLALVEQEMETYYGARSEQWQEADKGSEFQDRLDAVTEVREAIDGLDIG